MDKSINILFVVSLMFLGFFIIKQKKMRSREISNRLPVVLNGNFNIGYVSYCVFFALMILAAFDIKGKSVKTNAPSSNAAISIIIDFSSSMRVQDVSKSRYKLAIDFVKDLTRDLVGTKMRVFVYSDKPYKLVPFTNDIDYIHTKLSAIKKNLFPVGGSDLHLGLKELVAGEKNSTLLVVSDFEKIDTSAINSIINDKELRFIAVGVGTPNGGAIPRGKNKLLSGFLMNRGKKVISRYDSDSLDKVNYYKKFILNSSNYPIDALKATLNDLSILNKSESQDNDYLRARYFHYIIIFSCFVLLISLFYRNIRSPVTFYMLLVFISCSPAFCLSPFEVNELGRKYFFESLDKKKDEKGGEELDESDKSLVLFEENYKRVSHNEVNELIKVANYSTSLIKNKKPREGLNISHTSKAFESKEKSFFLRQNIVLLLKSEKARRGSGKGDSKNAKKKKGKNSKEEKKSSSGKKKKHDRKLTDEQRSLLKKLMGDDQVSQAEYIKKNIKLKSNSKGDRW